MSFQSCLQSLRSTLAAGRGQRNHRRRGSPRAATHRPSLEVLEVRSLLSTFTVTNLLDSGPDSLRAAVASANANPGPDAIDLATTGTITLTSGQLSITDSLTISGPGIDALTISGGGASRVFLLPAGNRTVSIANLTVANGWASSPDLNGGIYMVGGGIYMGGGTLTLDHCTVSGNYAVNEGAGIYMTACTLALNQCTVSGNHAEDYGGGGALGGGLYVAGGTLTLDQCTVAYNSAVGSPGYYADFGYDGGRAEGGGLYVAHGTVSVNQSNVYGNSAVGGEGRVDPFYTTPGNGGLARGGGIRIAGGGLEVRQSTFSGNMAVGGLAGSEDNYPIGGGLPGVGEGGGLFISRYDANPVAYLDTFTVDHTINNNPDNIVGPYFLAGMPMLAIRDATVLEGNTGTTNVVFVVSLSAASDQPVTVSYATANGTATAGSDYVAASGTLTIPAGQMTGTITVLVNGDRLAEPNETFVVNLSSPTSATVADGLGVGSIIDDEPRISISDLTKSEGKKNQTTTLTFTVTLSAAYDQPVTMSFRTVDGTATTSDRDYVARTGTLTFAAGETSKTITIVIQGDSKRESDETFYLDLFGNSSNSLLTKKRGIGTILNDD
jgi:predicted outer membrane repeat protein